jgi:hypothetical protein
MLQEVSASFAERARKNAVLASRFHVLTPAKLDSRRDQNSIILVSKYAFNVGSVAEVTELVEQELFQKAGKKRVPVANGDIFAVYIRDVLGREYVLASFHGDTNGLATIRVTDAVRQTVKIFNEKSGEGGGHVRLVFGLDANTYQKGSRKKQDMQEFVDSFSNNGLVSCFGAHPNPNSFTTFNARTFLQPQLQKGVRMAERDVKGDRNPKDFILFSQGDFMPENTIKDNTGRKEYVEGMVFPTLSFPSDHGILSTTLLFVEE